MLMRERKRQYQAQADLSKSQIQVQRIQTWHLLLKKLTKTDVSMSCQMFIFCQPRRRGYLNCSKTHSLFVNGMEPRVLKWTKLAVKSLWLHWKKTSTDQMVFRQKLKYIVDLRTNRNFIHSLQSVLMFVSDDNEYKFRLYDQ